ncbi:alpha-galactosidase [Antribacter sp. KLBMP9083]|uniref:Alpha-galactosidase n=1 Tax=Antribacter soli TaxID=2910976 RepID=A0AA41U5X2_9MICO|nr:glycoside hydrolase family 36 protein [Antribacter soli]MCF4119700.1 alpha-galactosidase [Antribacter soli]MCF4123462.1 alpha-galactosidase [Antribacter soli]
MTANDRPAATRVTLWAPDGLVLVLPDDAPAGLSTGGAGTPTQPLVEILAVGHGHASANTRNTATSIGARLRVLGHDVERADGCAIVQVRQGDPVTGLLVTSHLRVRDGGSSLQSWTSVRNDGSAPVVLQAVSSLMIGRPVGTTPVAGTLSLEGHGEWVGENRWAWTPLSGQDGLVTLDLPAHQHQDARGARSVVGAGSWSSGRRNPCGVVASEHGRSLAWQIEHNGAWRAELGVRLDANGDELLVLGLLGPTDDDHAWTHILGVGESFESVPVSLAAASGWQEALGEMTRHRRASRRNPRRPGVVFNDYMNTLMGDPTTDKLLPLVDAAARAGAEYFCIDAGWYDDGGDWWDSVGLWEPSTSRFPDGGLRRVVDAIRAAGMVPGLWLEPEVVGVRSPLADLLPDEAFLQRHGTRIAEHGRYLLDLRHRDVIKHLDEVVDRLIEDFGVGYFKLDYNVTPGAGTDLGADSPGDGLLQQNRAHLDWIDGVLARHPDLVIENCASGAMRADYALLSRLDLQSTSDQQNPLLYPPIAAGALVAIAPEQAANWAYPQPEMSDEQIVFTLCTGLAGRLYLSGRLDDMTAEQSALVARGVELAKRWTPRLVDSVPFWPLGLPTWSAPLVAAGLRSADESLVVVWWRGPEATAIDLDLPAGSVDTAYGPPDDGWDVTRDGDGPVHLRIPAGPQARVLRVRHAGLV